MGKASTSESVLIETTTFYRTQVMFGQEIEAKVQMNQRILYSQAKDKNSAATRRKLKAMMGG